MPWTTKLLVVASQTADSDELLEHLRTRAEKGPIQVTLVVPADHGGRVALAVDRGPARCAVRRP
jgi:hypothetical protein